MTDNGRAAESPVATPIAQDQAPLDRLVNLVEEFAERGLAHHRAETRWRTIKRTLLLAGGFGLAAMYLALYAPLLDPKVGPTRPNVAVISIQGPIAANTDAAASKVVPLIEEACAQQLTKGMVLRISSGGGSPTEAERIGAAVRRCRADRDDLRIDAVIEGMGASAAYLIAVEGDQVVANRYALVGSIGAVISAYDASEAAQRIGVTERAFASGPLKVANGLLVANTPEQDAAMQDVVERVGAVFAGAVRAARGERLVEAPDLFSGRVWTAEQALELGLIDQIAVLEDHIESTHGALPVFQYRPRQTIHERLGLQDALAGALREAMADAAEWQIR